MTALHSSPQRTCAPSSSAARRVLLIEDEPDNLTTLRLIVELWGYEVEVADNGVEGVHKALDYGPDVAIVDIGLPGVDGYEVARRLRAAFGNDILLIALTGYATRDDRRRAHQAGFDIHMPKPADYKLLADLLRKGLPV